MPSAARVGWKRRQWSEGRCRSAATRLQRHERDRRRSATSPSLLRPWTRRLFPQQSLSTRDDTNSATQSNPASADVDPPESLDTPDDPQHQDGTQGAKEMTWGRLVPRQLQEFWSGSASAQYLRESMAVLWRNLWTLMSLTALNSAARFVLVWTLYKTVCAGGRCIMGRDRCREWCVVAVQFFGIPAESIPHEMIPTSGSSGDPNVYQQLADITFLLFKPFDFVLKGVFIAAGLLVCWESSSENRPSDEGPARWRLIREMWSGMLKSFTSSWESLGRSPQYMRIYIVVGAMTALYQGLCLLIVPLLFAIKRLMNIQLAICVSLLQGKKWKEALTTSTSLVEPVRKHLYFPYLSLLLMPKALGLARDFVVKVFPDRLFVDVPEITWGIIAATTVSAFLIDRMAEIFPFVIYSSALKGQQAKNC